MPTAHELEVVRVYRQLRGRIKDQEERAKILRVSQPTISRYDKLAEDGEAPPINEAGLGRMKEALERTDAAEREREEKLIAARWMVRVAKQLEAEAKAPAAYVPGVDVEAADELSELAAESDQGGSQEEPSPPKGSRPRKTRGSRG